MSVKVPPVSSATVQRGLPPEDLESDRCAAFTVGYSAFMTTARVAFLSSVLTIAACGEGRGGVATDLPGAAPLGPSSAAPPAVASPVEPGPIHKLTVTDLDGNPVSLSRFAGRPLIIEVWATWCGPCLANRATVHSVRKSMPERVQVIGLSIDADSARGKGRDLVRNFLKSNPANDFEGMASEEFLAFMRTINPSNSIPKTMYVDSKGRVADLSEGTQAAKWLAAMARNLK